MDKIQKLIDELYDRTFVSAPVIIEIDSKIEVEISGVSPWEKKVGRERRKNIKL